MPLYGRSRDVKLIKQLNYELIHSIIEQQVGYYKIKLDETPTNLYGESLNKTLIGPVLIKCLIRRGSAEWETSDKMAPDHNRKNTFKFLKDDMIRANVFPEVGDVVLYNEMYFEVDSVNENQLIVGKDPDYSYSDNVKNHGASLSIIIEGHYINPERWGISKNRL